MKQLGFLLLLSFGFELTAAGQGPLKRAPMFEALVDKAIEHGVNALLRGLENPLTGHSQTYPVGFRALLAYALIEAGHSEESDEVQSLLKQVLAKPSERVYSVSLAVMALDAYEAKRSQSKSQASQLISGEAARRGIAERLEWLVKAQVPRLGVWGYGHRDPDWQDYSNTQFATLALQVGILRGADLPSRNLKELLSSFKATAVVGKTPLTLEVEGPGWWKEERRPSRTGPRKMIRPREGGFTLATSPVGWPYRVAIQDRPGRAPPSLSMTAAAVSSLIVIRGASGKRVDRDLDRMVAGGLAQIYRRWIDLLPSTGDTIHRNYFYTLYSVEKALDLAGVRRLGEIDWYRDQAMVLLREQGPRGLWGAVNLSRDYQLVSTAFALLFLKRATQRLRLDPPEPVFTGAGADDLRNTGVRKRRVFIPSLKGIIQLDEFFEIARAKRNSESVSLLEELIAVAPPQELPELIPDLLTLRNSSRDALDRVARQSLEHLTGLDSDKASDEMALKWLDCWRQLIALGDGPPVEETERLGRILTEVPVLTLPIKKSAVAAALRIGFPGCVEDLLSFFDQAPGEFQRQLHRSLSSLTQEQVALEPLDTCASRWQSLWIRKGERLIRDYHWSRYKFDLETASTPEARTRAVEALVSLGTSILPQVEQIVASSQFAFDWVRVRNRLLEKPRGF